VSACAQRFAERSKSDLKAVYDLKSLLNTLRIALTPPTTDGTRLTALVQEFTRILGLLPTGIKRGELYTVQFGLGILRDHVAQFLTEAARLTEDDVKIAAVFLPLAKRRCDTRGADWTTDLISATVNSLETLIGL